MKKDIEQIEVKDVYVAIVPVEDGEANEWAVHLVNLKQVDLSNVLVTASAKGKIDGVEKETASLRFFLDTVASNTARKFEIILPETLALQNRYWVSFYEDGQIQDKKFIAEPQVLNDIELNPVPLLNTPGILLH